MGLPEGLFKPSLFSLLKPSEMSYEKIHKKHQTLKNQICRKLLRVENSSITHLAEKWLHRQMTCH